jgi:hypothetical protein
MKNVSLFTLVLTVIVLCSGCTEVTFSEPMPYNRANRTFPQSWCGDWSYHGDSDDLDSKITIHPQYIALQDDDDNLVLGEGRVLRRFNGYFLLNTADADANSDEDARWVVVFAKRNGDVLSIYKFDVDDESKVACWETILIPDQFEKTTKSSDNKDIEEYKMEPGNNATFRKLINEGGLSHIGDYVR